MPTTKEIGLPQVWSCGVMFYELLMLDLPFPGNVVYIVQTRILNSAPAKLRGPYRGAEGYTSSGPLPMLT